MFLEILATRKSSPGRPQINFFNRFSRDILFSSLISVALFVFIFLVLFWVFFWFFFASLWFAETRLLFWSYSKEDSFDLFLVFCSGFGIFTNKDVAKGQFLLEYEGEFTSSEVTQYYLEYTILFGIRPTTQYYLE